MPQAPHPTPVIKNKKARFQYEILEKHECGIVLTGSEVKSLRSGKASLEESFALIRGGEAFLRDFNIQPYAQASGLSQHEPTRERKLLMRRREIKKLFEQVSRKGLTLIPMKLFFNDRGLAKVLIGLARGKKLHDKRQDTKKREAQRDMERAMRRRR
jgi:SsrA-binding protein